MSSDQVMADLYIRTQGQPIQAIQTGLRMLGRRSPPSFTIMGVGATGSARQLTGVILVADAGKE